MKTHYKCKIADHFLVKKTVVFDLDETLIHCNEN